MTTQKTDRDRWADPATGGIFAFSLIQGGRGESVADGLQAFAAAWFDCYEDETDLPAAWFTLKELAEDIGLTLEMDDDEEGDDDE